MGLREVISKFTGQVIQQGLVAKVLGKLQCFYLFINLFVKLEFKSCAC